MAALHIPRYNCAVNFALTCEDIRKMSDRLDYLIRAFQAVYDERSWTLQLNGPCLQTTESRMQLFTMIFTTPIDALRL